MPQQTGTELVTTTAAHDAPTALQPHLSTDLANSQFLVLFGTGSLIWVPGLGWMFWDDKRWQRDEGSIHVNERAKHTILTIWGSRDLPNAPSVDWIRQSQNLGRLRGMVELARTDPALAVYVDQLDAHPNELNTQSGILDLETFALREHDPAAFHTRITNAGYVPDAKAPFWLETVEKALPDPEIRRHVQKAFGQALRGTYSENLFIFHGDGGNLKSTILGGVLDVVGDYGDVPSADFLIEQKSGSARGDSALAQLRGVRLVVASETGDGLPLAEPLVKTLTGDHVINAKYMRQDTFSYRNQSSVFLATNHRPRVQGSDEAIWRRLQLVPFNYVEKKRMGPGRGPGEAAGRARRHPPLVDRRAAAVAQGGPEANPGGDPQRDQSLPR